MRFTQSEKHEIIQLVEGSGIGVNKTLLELGIHKRTFYNWYGRYLSGGFDALAPQRPKGSQKQVWNKIPAGEKNHVVEIALDKTAPQDLQSTAPQDLQSCGISEIQYLDNP